MTVPVSTSRVDFTGNASTVDFVTPFVFDTSDQLEVKLILISSGAETIQVEGVDYDVTGGDGSTGTVTFDTAPTALYTVRIERTVDLVQSTAFTTQGSFAPATHEAAFDYARFVDQQLDRRISDLEDAPDVSGTVVAGNGLYFSSTTLHVGDGDGIIANADSIEVDFTSGDLPQSVDANTGSLGVSTSASRSDHKHPVATMTPGAIQPDDAAAEGVSTALARADHKHSIVAGTPVDITKAAASEGVATTFSRGDHKHDVSTATPVSITTANAEGSATSLARSDHTHDHGTLAGGDRHAAASTSTAGFMSAADKTAFDAFIATTSTGTVSTTDATPTTVLTWTPTAGTVETVELEVIGIISNASAAAGYGRAFTVKRGDPTTQVGTTTTLWTHEDTAGWDVTVSISSPAVVIQVTGAAASNIAWSCTARRFTRAV